MTTDALDAGFLSAYGIGPGVSTETLGGGMFLRPVLLTTSTGRFVLRRHSFRTRDETFRFQAEALEYVAAESIRCPVVLRDREGRFGRPRDGVFLALHRYIEGRQYPWTEWHAAKDRAGFLVTIGAQVARVHDALSRATPGGDDSLSPSLPPVRFHAIDEIREQWERDLGRLAGIEAASSVRALRENRTELDEHWRTLSRAVDRLGIPDWPRQIVHGDVSPVNMIFDRDGQTFTLIDWDCLHRGLRLYDALGDVLHRPPLELAGSAPFREDHLGAYLHGYQKASAWPIPREELRAAPLFSLARQFEDLRQRMHVLPALPAAEDAGYATLIQGRVRMMRLIRAQSTPDLLWEPSL